jgi:hypothetical protein
MAHNRRNPLFQRECALQSDESRGSVFSFVNRSFLEVQRSYIICVISGFRVRAPVTGQRKLINVHKILSLSEKKTVWLSTGDHSMQTNSCQFRTIMFSLDMLVLSPNPASGTRWWFCPRETEKQGNPRRGYPKYDRSPPVWTWPNHGQTAFWQWPTDTFPRSPGE